MTENVIKDRSFNIVRGGGEVKRKIVILCRATNNFVENDKKNFQKTRPFPQKNRERYRNRYQIFGTEQGGGTGEEKALHRHRKVCAEHPGMPKPMDSFPILCYYKE